MAEKQIVELNQDDFVLDEKPLKLSKIEKKKFKVISQLIDGEINGTQAAKKLDITTRQVRNLKRQVLNEGKLGVVHKNKNYKPYNTYDEEIYTFVCKTYRREFRGVNFSEFARVMQEEYGVQASRSTIYNFLRKGHIRSPQRKAKIKRVVSYDKQSNKVISMVRVYDRDTTSFRQGRKVVISSKVIPQKKETK